MPNFEHALAAVWHPDEHGSAYISFHFGGGVSRKTVTRQINLDLNDAGEVVGMEILDCPPLAIHGPAFELKENANG